MRKILASILEVFQVLGMAVLLLASLSSLYILMWLIG